MRSPVEMACAKFLWCVKMLSLTVLSMGKIQIMIRTYGRERYGKESDANEFPLIIVAWILQGWSSMP